MNINVDSIVGTSLKELSEDELMYVYGGNSEVTPQSSLACSIFASFLSSYLASAAFKCGKDNKRK